MKNLTIKLFFKIFKVKVLILLLGLNLILNIAPTDWQKAFPQETKLSLALDINCCEIFQRVSEFIKTICTPEFIYKQTNPQFYLIPSKHRSNWDIPHHSHRSSKFPRWSKCTFT